MRSCGWLVLPDIVQLPEEDDLRSSLSLGQVVVGFDLNMVALEGVANGVIDLPLFTIFFVCHEDAQWAVTLG